MFTTTVNSTGGIARRFIELRSARQGVANEVVLRGKQNTTENLAISTTPSHSVRGRIVHPDIDFYGVVASRRLLQEGAEERRV